MGRLKPQHRRLRPAPWRSRRIVGGAWHVQLLASTMDSWKRAGTKLRRALYRARHSSSPGSPIQRKDRSHKTRTRHWQGHRARYEELANARSRESEMHTTLPEALSREGPAEDRAAPSATSFSGCPQATAHSNQNELR